MLLGCYTETLAFLQDIGAGGNVRAQPQLSVTMIDAKGRRSRLACPPLPSPWHLLAGVIEWDALEWSDRLAVLRMAQPLKLARDPAKRAASPGETVESWLVRHGQTERLREMLWRSLALAALNQPADRAGATLFARVLAEMFAGDARAAAIVLPTKPLEAMRRARARLSRRAAALGPAPRHQCRRGQPRGSRRSGRRTLDARRRHCRRSVARIPSLFESTRPARRHRACGRRR